MARRPAIGIQDFAKIIKNDCFYIDKTLFMKEWWENMDDVTLIARPRRFGKTLTMRMVERFFSVKYAKDRILFEKLKIWQDEKYHFLQGKYPVIFLSFSRVKGTNYETVREMICQVLTDLYAEHRYILEGGILTESEKIYFCEVSDHMKDSTAAAALNRLSFFLYKYYKQKVIILLDEYDTPMSEAYLHGYWDAMSEFVRCLLHASFKDNPYMERGILTGITRVGKESIFSDLNNIEVVTTTSIKYETAFGFTEEEVFAALEEFGLSDKKQEVKCWYDGFCFGRRDSIYNPWSVLNFLDKKRFGAYWANTSSNSLAGNLIHDGGIEIKLVMEDLLMGRSLQAAIDEEIVFQQLDRKKSAVWSLLLAGGYLKVVKIVRNRRGREEYVLTLTNREVQFMFDEMVTDWFSNKNMEYNQFSNALIAGNKEYMNEYMNVIAEETFSSFDAGTKPSAFRQPENFYHGFTLGLIAELRNIYRITSNRESGRGRYDVLLEPLDSAVNDGIILEFKVQDTNIEKTLQDTVDMALQQIIDKKYASMLTSKGIPMERIRIYGFAFRGKEILVNGGVITDYTCISGQKDE